jgi:hypothetical protein
MNLLTRDHSSSDESVEIDDFASSIDDSSSERGSEDESSGSEEDASSTKYMTKRQKKRLAKTLLNRGWGSFI